MFLRFAIRRPGETTQGEARDQGPSSANAVVCIPVEGQARRQSAMRDELSIVQRSFLLKLCSNVSSPLDSGKMSSWRSVVCISGFSAYAAHVSRIVASATRRTSLVSGYCFEMSDESSRSARQVSRARKALGDVPAVIPGARGLPENIR